MSDLKKIGDKLYFIFDNTWKPIKELNEEFCSRKTFHLSKGRYFFIDSERNLVDEFQEEVAFEIGDVQGEFIELNKVVFNLKNNFKIHLSLQKKIKLKHFITYPSRVSIFKKIDEVLNDDFIIVPSEFTDETVNFITFEEFDELVRSFPTKTTFFHYTNKVLTEKFEDFFEIKKDYIRIFEKHLNRTNNVRVFSSTFSNEVDKEIADSEIKKFSCAIDLLEKMLQDGEVDEKMWQKSILNILLLIYPQYQFAIDEVAMENLRRVDFILVDLFNNIDIIEIKRPEKQILRKALYRDNYVPSHELTGTVMQVEYYIRQLTEKSHPNKLRIEKKLRENNFHDDIQINNVKGMII